MEALFIIGTILLVIAILTTIGTVVYSLGGLKSAKSQDYLEEFYEDEYRD